MSMYVRVCTSERKTDRERERIESAWASERKEEQREQRRTPLHRPLSSKRGGDERAGLV